MLRELHLQLYLSYFVFHLNSFPVFVVLFLLLVYGFVVFYGLFPFCPQVVIGSKLDNSCVSERRGLVEAKLSALLLDERARFRHVLQRVGA